MIAEDRRDMADAARRQFAECESGMRHLLGRGCECPDQIPFLLSALEAAEAELVIEHGLTDNLTREVVRHATAHQRLLDVIDAAPHGPDCIRLEDHKGRPCDCWKSKA